MLKTGVNMLEGSITKGLLSMTIPIMIMNVFQSLFNVLDMTILGNFSDDGAVGAVGACGVLISLCTALLIGIASGANVIVARRLGAGEKERCARAAETAVIVSLVGGALLMAIGLVFAKTFLIMANCPETLLSRAAEYFRLYFLAVPGLMLYNFCASILRASGDTKRPMYFLILGSIIKIGCNILLVGVFNADVAGVGIATIVSNVIIGSLSFVTLLKYQNEIPLDIKKARIDINELKAMLFIGVPAGLQSSLYSFANVLISSVVNSFGEAATTGISIANQFDGIMYQVIYAPSLAATPYIAQNIGAGNIKRAKKSVLSAVFITIAFGASLGALSAIFSGQLSSIISKSPEVIAYSKQKMMLISSTYFICGINEVLGGVLRGMGHPVAPAMATLVFMCAFRFFWVYVIFPLCSNLSFLYVVWPISWILSIVTLLCVYFPTVTKLQREYSAQ